MTERHLTDVRFDALAIDPAVLAGIREAGFESCTPIQGATLPDALTGSDVAGQAQTGTGKTAAFLIAAFHHLLQTEPLPGRRPNDPRAVMLAPTRELAVQIHKDAEILNRHTGFKLALAFGGTDYEKQRKQIEAGCDVLIGTPGRIIDYFKQKVFRFSCCQVVVLDEADRMFDLGFISDIRFVLRRMPEPGQRLNMLFSATLSQRVLELAYEHMNDPELVQIEPERVTPDRIRQLIYYPSNREKIPLLIGLLRQMDPRRTMVFVNRRRESERLQRFLEANGIDARAMSGDVPQKKRLRLLRDFQSGELPVLIGTDVASRGLHIPGVSHVFNFDLPDDAEDYVHRIGRTARAGAEGDAISFGCEDYAQNLPAIEKYVGYKIPVEAIDPALLVDIKIPPRPPRKPHNKRGGPPARGRGGRPPRRRK
ncbi:MAG: DEAD/DEAH box helicase [Gammaproteobacteria bacterium]|nr:DEAD/DEAH box helicase [Gammaproteobacteria bacterium]NNF61413.1 DEAD/DEAH box helicase [Gammaproteobacteria bacterium]NNM19812.1 DEAD/DEAH box helicase [Gammaproteobacteria bacterium]